MVRPLTKNRRVGTSFECQHVKGYKTLVKSWWEHFYHIFPSLWREMIWKISPWLRFEIIGMLINTWTGDYKYPVAQCENLPFPIKMISSLKPKTFSEFFFHLWNLHQILNIFKKNKIVIANVFPKLTTL